METVAQIEILDEKVLKDSSNIFPLVRPLRIKEEYKPIAPSLDGEYFDTGYVTVSYRTTAFFGFIKKKTRHVLGRYFVEIPEEFANKYALLRPIPIFLTTCAGRPKTVIASFEEGNIAWSDDNMDNAFVVIKEVILGTMEDLEENESNLSEFAWQQLIALREFIKRK